VILVTGGSGFIGSHVVDKLIEKGYKVAVFDKTKPLREDVDWRQGDLLNENEVLEACRDAEVIFHLAAIADVNVALSHPELCLQINEVGTSNILKAATARETERVILASTIWVYGNREGMVDEDTPIQMPDHIYTKTKIGQEHLLVTWQKHFGLSYTILRYGIPYGPRMRPNMVIATFVSKAIRKEPVTIFGDGMQGRNFIYAEDLAEGNIAALSSKAKNQIVNIAGSEFITINQLINNLEQLFGKMNIEYKPERPSDFRGNGVSIAKANDLLNWRPKTTFGVGLVKYVDWVRNNTKGI
jgi:UDP-glucose 4-epimerase